MSKERLKDDASIFFEVLKKTPKATKDYVAKSLEIAHQISTLLKERGWSQKDLADKLQKTEPEVSKWLSGTHNFTMRTLTSIATAMDEEIVVTPLKVRSNAHWYTVPRTFRASLNEKAVNVGAETYKVGAGVESGKVQEKAA